MTSFLTIEHPIRVCIDGERKQTKHRRKEICSLKCKYVSTCKEATTIN